MMNSFAAKGSSTYGPPRAEWRHGHDDRGRAGVCGDVVERPTVGEVGEHDVGAAQQPRDFRRALLLTDFFPAAR